MALRDMKICRGLNPFVCYDSVLPARIHRPLRRRIDVNACAELEEGRPCGRTAPVFGEVDGLLVHCRTKVQREARDHRDRQTDT